MKEHREELVRERRGEEDEEGKKVKEHREELVRERRGEEEEGKKLKNHRRTGEGKMGKG